MGLARRELQGKIAGAKRVRRAALLGLGVGVAAVFAGLLLQVSILFLVGYTVFIVCTGITSFVTVLNWQYNKALKTLMERSEKPTVETKCSRCGTQVDADEKYCPKCGKKVPARKR
jgi:DNA-directed RNA polymerase subunit RPC12/RpoP